MGDVSQRVSLIAVRLTATHGGNVTVVGALEAIGLGLLIAGLIEAYVWWFDLRKAKWD